MKVCESLWNIVLVNGVNLKFISRWIQAIHGMGLHLEDVLCVTALPQISRLGCSAFRIYDVAIDLIIQSANHCTNRWFKTSFHWKTFAEYCRRWQWVVSGFEQLSENRLKFNGIRFAFYHWLHEMMQKIELRIICNEMSIFYCNCFCVEREPQWMTSPTDRCSLRAFASLKVLQLN